MPAPVFGSSGTQLTAGSGTSAVLGAPAGIAANDILVAFIYLESNVSVTPPAGWTAAGSSPIATSGGLFNQLVVFWKRPTGAESGSYTFTFSGSSHRRGRVLRYTDAATTGDPFDVTNAAQRSTSATATPAVSVTTTGPDMLLIWVGTHWDSGNWTVPTGYTARSTASSETWVVADDELLVAGASGDVVGSCTTSSTSVAWIGALRSAAVPVSITDTATVTDAELTVDKTDLLAISEQLTTADALEVFADWDALVDEVQLADPLAIEELVDVDLTDIVSFADGLEVADFIGNDYIDEFQVSDSLDVERTTFVEITETFTVADDRALEQTRNLTDTGQLADVFVLLGEPSLTDLFVVDDLITVVDIPFTLVLLPRPQTVYDLVVVARVPQVAGPPALLLVDPIEWSTLEYTQTLSQPAELSADCLVGSITPEVAQRLRNPDELATELWLYRDGVVIFAGPLMPGWQTTGESVTIRARGLLYYLRMWTVTADLRFDQQDQFDFVKTMVDQRQALEYGSVGIDTSTVGASGILRDGSYARDELHNVGQRVEELGKRENGFDAEVDPSSRKLQLWHPQKGVDRSVGEDAIVFDSRNITSSDVMCSVAPEDLASEAFGTSTSTGADTVLYSAQSNLELRAKYGRFDVTNTWSDISEQTTLDAHVSGLLAARGRALLMPGPRVRVTPDAELGAYSVGDTVAYELHSQLGVSGTFRIRQQKVIVSSTGQETVDLAFV